MIKALNAIAVVVAAALAVALYIAKTEAQGSQERLAELQADLAEERRQINVLNVEVAHLEDPERLRALARRYLGFEPLDPSREVAMSDLPVMVGPDGDLTPTERTTLLVNQVEEGQQVLAETHTAGGSD